MKRKMCYELWEHKEEDFHKKIENAKRLANELWQ
jgi:hypothetical protein